MTARARIPGARKLMESLRVDGARRILDRKTSRTTGMATVSRSDSPRLRVIPTSALVWASKPAQGHSVSPAVPHRSDAPVPHVFHGLQVGVLQGTASGPQIGQGESGASSQAARAATRPAEAARPEVLTGPLLGDVARRPPRGRRPAPRTSTPGERRNDPGARPARRPVRPPSPGHGPAPGQDDDLVGQPFGFGQFVGGEDDADPPGPGAPAMTSRMASRPSGPPRPWVRRGRRPRAGPPGPGPARASAARPPTAAPGRPGHRPQPHQVEQGLGILAPASRGRKVPGPVGPPCTG